jgi:bifunctional non-homologous end joining protein LigD
MNFEPSKDVTIYDTARELNISERASGFRPSDLGGNLQWLKPELVCEVNFAEVTEDGIFRQASFKGMRTDKKAQEVIREILQDTQRR